MWQVEHYWAVIATGTTCLAVGIIWGSWPGGLLSDLRSAQESAYEARKREAKTQAHNLELMRQLEAARQASVARLAKPDPGDPT